MDNQRNLKNIGIGKIATPKLEAVECEVQNVDTELVEKAKANKAVFYLKHPKKKRMLRFLQLPYLKKRKVRRK